MTFTIKPERVKPHLIKNHNLKDEGVEECKYFHFQPRLWWYLTIMCIQAFCNKTGIANLNNECMKCTNRLKSGQVLSPGLSIPICKMEITSSSCCFMYLTKICRKFLCARCHSKHFDSVNRYNPYNKLMKEGLLFFPFYRWRNWGTERLSDLAKLT